MQNIAVLLTVFNRKPKTLQCLQNLYAQLPVEGCEVDVYLTDDGCTDGTPEAVGEQFPQVNIIRADGNLFWNRGMYTAWKKAAETKDYDFYLWLNDDTIIYPNAVRMILDASGQKEDKAIICGPTCSAMDGHTTYSGSISNKLISPDGNLQECTVVNGNFLLIPRIVYRKVGNLDWSFRHAIGDFDYGLRAQEAGFKCFVAPVYIGVCENNPTLPKWCLKSTPLLKRIKILYSPLGYAEPIPFFIYEKRHFGLLVAMKHFITIHIRVLFPGLWK